MIKYVVYSLNGDYYLDKVLSVLFDKGLVDNLVSDYYELVDDYQKIENFKMNFDTDLTYREQLKLYLCGNMWNNFKMGKYLRVQTSLNVTDETMYDLLYNRYELDYWELDDNPQ